MDFYDAGNFFMVLGIPLELFLQCWRLLWSYFKGVGDFIGAILTVSKILLGALFYAEGRGSWRVIFSDGDFFTVLETS